ncbi:reverse transcriptase domain-containing protein [Alicyclobacillus shizuokensis]|uniref:reverse transcriptase domain-containing protein n=1 Tax=Alicyclobacillus shizuokensis TaxID=392014 RepID=UPI001FE1D7FB|nr:reverse transcriptase domain-containing protein [Alicyclobacillus shizuokensis]
MDRLIQQALLQILTPIFDPDFSKHSYGFRPGRSVHDAVQRAQKHIQDGYRWAVDLDMALSMDATSGIIYHLQSVSGGWFLSYPAKTWAWQTRWSRAGPCHSTPVGRHVGRSSQAILAVIPRIHPHIDRPTSPFRRSHIRPV